MNTLRAWWASLSGTTKGWLEGLGYAAAAGGLDVAVQELSAEPGMVVSLDPKAIGAAALLAGVVYIKGNLKGLLRYPDGSPVHVDPAPANPPPPSLAAGGARRL